ncbi:MAG TPA: hypothetical protein VES20_11430 [Bryobacteraceae bacterium]|nr:hypothetical protein [Bryobacteraceae bacterium]
MTTECVYRNRRAVQIENEHLRVTVLIEGGHIAEILHKATQTNPLWTPGWPSIEPSSYEERLHPEYGLNAESKLLAGIMGHNVCVDLFGGPSEDEAAAGVTVHGEASVLPYDIQSDGTTMRCVCTMPLSSMRFERTLTLDNASEVRIDEAVISESAWDRPIAWTQHVTLGPPFLERGRTAFELTATRSRTYDGEFGTLFDRGVEFDWPQAPLRGGGVYDLRTYTELSSSAGFTTHLMDPALENASFHATSGALVFGYRWKREDFPWLGIWEENCFRQSAPWNGTAITRGMEFGVSPQAESRRAMIDRGSLFGVPGYRWLPAKGTLRASYSAFIGYTDDLLR